MNSKNVFGTYCKVKYNIMDLLHWLYKDGKPTMTKYSREDQLSVLILPQSACLTHFFLYRNILAAKDKGPSCHVMSDFGHCDDHCQLI